MCEGLYFVLRAALYSVVCGTSAEKRIGALSGARRGAAYVAILSLAAEVYRPRILRPRLGIRNSHA